MPHITCLPMGSSWPGALGEPAFTIAAPVGCVFWRGRVRARSGCGVQALPWIQVTAAAIGARLQEDCPGHRAPAVAANRTSVVAEPDARILTRVLQRGVEPAPGGKWYAAAAASHPSSILKIADAGVGRQHLHERSPEQAGG
jgi:hypothetical protein